MNKFHRALAINNAKLLNPTQKLKTLSCAILYVACLCLDMLSYIVIDDRDALSSDK